MPAKTKSVFFAIVIVIVGYAIYDYRDSDTREQVLALKKTLLYGHRPGAQVSLVNGDSQIVLRKLNDRWFIEQPIADEARSQKVDRMIRTIFNEQVSALPGQDLAIEKYGFSRLDRYFNFETDGIGKIFVSNKPAYDGSSYIYFNKRLYIGSPSWREWLKKTPQQLRNKLPFKDIGQITSYEYKGLKLKLTEDGWQLVGDESYKIDHKLVQEAILLLKNLRIVAVVSEEASDKALKQFKIGENKHILKLSNKAGESFEVFFGKKLKKKISFKFSARPFIYEASQASVANWQLDRSKITLTQIDEQRAK